MGYSTMTQCAMRMDAPGLKVSNVLAFVNIAMSAGVGGGGGMVVSMTWMLALVKPMDSANHAPASM